DQHQGGDQGARQQVADAERTPEQAPHQNQRDHGGDPVADPVPAGQLRDGSGHGTPPGKTASMYGVRSSRSPAASVLTWNSGPATTVSPAPSTTSASVGATISRGSMAPVPPAGSPSRSDSSSSPSDTVS